MNNDPFEIALAVSSDTPDLVNISRQTFIETFGALNTPENMLKYLDGAFNTSSILQEINDANSESYLVRFNKKIIGYLKINFGQSQTELKENKALEIERIYLLKEFHGKKIGKKLLNKTIAIARSKVFNYIWLGVWEKNYKAIDFYKRNGFVEFNKHIFVLGDDEQIDCMMKLEL